MLGGLCGKTGRVLGTGGGYELLKKSRAQPEGEAWGP